MRNIFALVLFLLLVGSGEHSRAQFGRPIPVPRPPPVAPHVGPHVPHTGADSSREDSSGFWYILGLVGLGVGGWYLIRHLWSNSASKVRIRITATPPGEAPEEVRRAWVGLELPLAPGETAPRPMAVVGVLSAEGESTLGYAVTGKTAVDLLASHDPAAADWWRESAPHVLAGGYQLVFPTEVCERIT